MNKNKKVAIIAFLIVALIIVIAAGYTFSKYYQSIEGTASTNVAAWSFKATAGDQTAITDIVLKGGKNEKIAPGSNGNFQIKVDSIGSDVDVKYHVDVVSENLPENMVFYIQGEENNKYNTLQELANAKLTGTLLTQGSQNKTYTIAWDWPFESYDKVSNTILDSKDFSDGTSEANYGFTIRIVGEQIEK